MHFLRILIIVCSCCAVTSSGFASALQSTSTATPCTASARTPSGTTPTADAHWRRPRWISWVPPAPPNASTALATRQAATNLAQRMRLSQLAKQHGHELAPTGETPRVPFSLVLLDRLFEIPAREQLQHLRENAAYFVQMLHTLYIG